MPPPPHDRPWCQGPVFRGRPFSQVTENWVTHGQWKGVGRQLARERQEPSHPVPVHLVLTPACSGPTFRPFVGKEERDRHRGDETGLRSSKRKVKSQCHRRRRGFK